MKQKFLIGACALAACLGACTNEDFLTEQPVNGNADNTAVVGADLVSHGMNIVVNGGAETRATNGAWQNGDRFGMGWYNYQLGQNGAADIKDEQNKSAWENAATYTWTSLALDNNIYANHMFTYNAEASSFWAAADIFQGAYFLYFPFASQSSAEGIKAKTIEVNAAEQTGNFAEERFNKALHISAQDFIEADDVLEAGQTLTKEFVLSPAVNVFGVKATPEAAIAGETENVNFFKSMNVMNMTINAGEGKNVFASKAELQPLYIPVVVKNGEENDVPETVDALDAAAEMALDGNYSAANGSARSYLTVETADMTNLLTTTVRNDYTVANVGADGNEIRAFAFPIKENVTYATDEAPEVKVRVGKWAAEPTVHNTYELGEFTIAGDENKTFNENLVKAFSEDILTKIIRNDADEWSYANLNATLLLDQFQPLTDNILSEEQWNDLVKVYDALADMGVEVTTTPVFKLGADVTFKGVNGTIATPKSINIMLETFPYNMTIDNTEEEIAWPANLLTGANSVVTVAEGTTLNVGLDEKKINILSEVRNNGLINAGPKAALGSENGQKVINNNRIVIKYGAYVYPNPGNEGIVAYRLEADAVEDADNDEVAKINKLMLNTAAQNKGLANINTLIVPEGKTLDLDAKISEAGQDGDRYEGDAPDVNDPLKNLDDITIELEGGTVKNGVYGTSANNHDFVKAVIAKEGDTSTMIDVQTTDITVEAGTLTIDAISYPLVGKHELTGVENITNNAGLDVLTDVEVESIENYGQIDVVAGKTVTYTTLNQENPATGERGSFTGNVVPAETAANPTVAAVMTAWNAMVEACANSTSNPRTIDTYADAVTEVNNHGNSSTSTQKAFLDAYNAWRTANSLSKVEYNSFSAGDLKSFESLTGMSFNLTES